jgi:hypothetical protein
MISRCQCHCWKVVNILNCALFKFWSSFLLSLKLSSRYVFSYHPFYFDFHSARIIFDVSSGFYLWNVNMTPTWHLSKLFKVAFKDISTKNSEPTYWTIFFVMVKIYFIYKFKNPEGLYKIELCPLPLGYRLFLSCDSHGVTDRTCKQKSCQK